MESIIPLSQTGSMEIVKDLSIRKKSFDDMPNEIYREIFEYLNHKELCTISLVNKKYQTLSDDRQLWKRLSMQIDDNSGNQVDHNYKNFFKNTYTQIIRSARNGLCQIERQLPYMLEDEQFGLACTENIFLSFKLKTLKCWDKKKFVLSAVSKPWLGGIPLAYASDTLKGDRDVVLAAVSQSGYALAYASDTLKKDKAFMLQVVSKDRVTLAYASDTLKKDRTFTL